MAKKKSSSPTLEKTGKDSVYKMTSHNPLNQDIFQHQGINYIVGPRVKRGGLFEVELKRIKGVTTMHIHQFYYGICFLCGYTQRGKEE